MKIRIFLPAIDHPASGTQLGWALFDSRGAVLREGRSIAADIPRAPVAEAVLPAQRVLFARLKLPRVNASTIRELLPYAVEDRLLADPAQIHAVAGATNARGETIVAVVDREWLRAMLAALAHDGLRVRGAWCESELAGRKHGEWHVVWGKARGLVIDDEGVAATFDPGPALPLALRIALDEAASRGNRPATIRVHAEGGASLPALPAWSTETGGHCVAAETWEERVAATPRAPIELLQGEMAPRSAFSWRFPRQAAAILGVIVLLQVAFTALDAWRLQHERRSIEGEREAIFREAFPEARVVVDPQLQMERNLADLRRTRGLAGGDEFLVQLTRASREARAPLKGLDYLNGRLTTR
jgi:general secretion pathway protein L